MTVRSQVQDDARLAAAGKKVCEYGTDGKGERAFGAQAYAAQASDTGTPGNARAHCVHGTVSGADPAAVADI